MSLIGSLEDLGLGDILQIIHLSQKSGVLSIRGDGGEGRIVLQKGMVRLASLKGDPEDLRGLLVARGFVNEADFEAAADQARESGDELATALARLTSLSLERIDSLRRECAESAVGKMFSWTTGEFSFDVGAEDEYLNSEMSLSTGVNAQYLAMESLRIWDEGVHAEAQRTGDPAAEGDETKLNFDLSAEEMFGVAHPVELAELVEDDVEPSEGFEELQPIEETEEAAWVAQPIEAIEPVAACPVTENSLPGPRDVSRVIAKDAAVGPLDVLVEATIEQVVPDRDDQGQSDRIDPEALDAVPVVDAAQRADAEPRFRNEAASPVIVIDASLPVLEWVRSALANSFASVHVFQRSQEGLGRIRQYLARAQAPILLISPEIEGNPLSGIVDAADFVRRLREQVPRMPIAWLVAEDDVDRHALPTALPTVAHPPQNELRSADSSQQQQALRRQLILTLRNESTRLAAASQERGGSPDLRAGNQREVASPEDFGRLKAATQLLSDASNRGEVLPLVIRFAAEFFERVAMFMVCGEQILGMAQFGIDVTGGPDDIEMRTLEFERSELSWFSQAIESGEPVRAPVRNAGDQRLRELLGGETRGNAYIAPITSTAQVVALLYADNGSSNDDLGDTSALEVVLHHAGLALDRAVLERALAEADQER